MKKMPFYMMLACLVCATHLQAQQKQAASRYATAEDAKAIHNANEGDYLITAGNIPSSSFPGYRSVDIQPSRSNTFRLDNSSKQYKILIKGGKYPYITISLPGVNGTHEHPIIITNYDGQVETKRLQIFGMKHVIVTGEFNAKEQTGDPDYPGHAKGYAYSSGKYGIYVNKAWGETIGTVDGKGSAIVTVAGAMLNGVEYPFPDVELAFIEGGDGGFTNVIRWNNHGGICDNMIIHDCYFHDTHGEGIYLGSTQKDPQTQFRNLKFYNNRVIRAGWDGVQFGKLLSAEIYNNVIHGSLCWKIADIGDFQDKSIQITAFTGDVTVKNNIFVAGGALTFSMATGQQVRGSGTLVVDNNLFLFCRKDFAGYYTDKGTGKLNGIRITNNVWGKNKCLMEEINPAVRNKPYLNQILAKVPLTVTGNVSDGTDGKTEFFTTESQSVTAENNVFVAETEFPEYINTGFPLEFDWLLLERWGKTITTGSRAGEPVAYQAGDYVVQQSVIVRALATNSGIEPGVHKDWEQYWEIVYFNEQTTPPDDFRLKKGSTYNVRGIGLLDNPK